MSGLAGVAMADAQQTFLIFAEVAVALAGFSGIIIAFGQRAHGSLSKLELRRLSNLFALSGYVLLASLLGVSLLHVETPDQDLVWRLESAILVLLGTPWLVTDWRKVTRLDPAERSQVRASIFYPFTVLAVLALALQIANIFYMGRSWPLFLGLLVVVSYAFQQFILLVRMAFRDV
jgi:hypothetical protein